MKRVLIYGVVAAVAVAAVWYSVGGRERPARAFGGPVGGQAVTISEVLASPEAYLGETVTVEGRIVRMCPTTGCWWYLDDGTGQLRVSSTAAGFALPLGQDGKRIRTTGKVVRNEGGELEIAATGAEFP